MELWRHGGLSSARCRCGVRRSGGRLLAPRRGGIEVGSAGGAVQGVRMDGAMDVWKHAVRA